MVFEASRVGLMCIDVHELEDLYQAPVTRNVFIY